MLNMSSLMAFTFSENAVFKYLISYMFISSFN